MFVGVYLIVINGSITGNVIGFGESYGNNILGFLGIMIFLIGFFLIVATATIEDVVGTETKSDISVYDSMQEQWDYRCTLARCQRGSQKKWD